MWPHSPQPAVEVCSSRITGPRWLLQPRAPAPPAWAVSSTGCVEARVRVESIFPCKHWNSGHTSSSSPGRGDARGLCRGARREERSQCILRETRLAFLLTREMGPRHQHTGQNGLAGTSSSAWPSSEELSRCTVLQSRVLLSCYHHTKGSQWGEKASQKPQQPSRGAEPLLNRGTWMSPEASITEVLNAGKTTAREHSAQGLVGRLAF